MRRQLGPPMRRRGHFRQRAGCESHRSRFQRRSRELPRGLQCEPIVDVGRDRPQLLSPLESVLAARLEIQEPVPRTRLAHAIDRAEEPIEVFPFDEVLDQLNRSAIFLAARVAIP
jgi:hypothetical protein